MVEPLGCYPSALTGTGGSIPPAPAKVGGVVTALFVAFTFVLFVLVDAVNNRTHRS